MPKKCPLLSIAEKRLVWCVKEECEWWYEPGQRCVLKAIVDLLWEITRR